MDAVTQPPAPTNETIRGYAPGSDERARLTAAVKALAEETVDLTMTIGGVQRMGAGARTSVVAPHKRARWASPSANCHSSSASRVCRFGCIRRAGNSPPSVGRSPCSAALVTLSSVGQH